ncbi:hypothetical protein MRX96_050137 [Rhipicephalus microplus]
MLARRPGVWTVNYTRRAGGRATQPLSPCRLYRCSKDVMYAKAFFTLGDSKQASPPSPPSFSSYRRTLFTESCLRARAVVSAPFGGGGFKERGERGWFHRLAGQISIGGRGQGRLNYTSITFVSSSQFHTNVPSRPTPKHDLRDAENEISGADEKS